ADPEDPLHHKIRVGQRPGDAVRHVAVRRLAGEIAAEEEAGRDFALFEEANGFVARKRRFRTNGDRKAEPARFAARRGFGQNQKLTEVGEAGVERGKVAASRLDKTIEL